MKLNLGCGHIRLDGFLNVDRMARPGVDVVADLEKPWPWATSSVDHIHAHHVYEHLTDKILTMNESHRVLKSGGILDIELPTTNGPGAWQDPTHRSFWNERSFLYYTEGGTWDALANLYGITAKFRITSQNTRQTGDGPIFRIVLSALK